MRTKEESAFWDDFVQLKAARLNSFFSDVMSKNEFISSLLVVLDSEPLHEAIKPTVEACGRLNANLDGDAFGSEIQFVSYRDGDFILGFFVTLKDIASFSKEPELYYHLEFPLSGVSYDVTPDIDSAEHLTVSESDFWEQMKTRVKIEWSFGTLKRSNKS